MFLNGDLPLIRPILNNYLFAITWPIPEISANSKKIKKQNKINKKNGSVKMKMLGIFIVLHVLYFMYVFALFF